MIALPENKLEVCLRQLNARYAANLVELGLRTIAGTGLSELFQEAARMVSVALNTEYCAILELVPEAKKLLLKKGAGWNAMHLGRALLETDEKTHSGQVMRGVEPVIVENFEIDARFAADAFLLDHGIKSALGVAFQGYERPYGMIGAYSKRPRSFEPDEIEFLLAVGCILTTAVKNNIAQTQRERLNRVIKTISNINRAVLEADDTGDLLQAVCRIITQVGRYQFAWIGLCESDGALHEVARHGDDKEHLKHVYFNGNRQVDFPGAAGALTSGRPIRMQHVPEDPAYESWRRKAAHGKVASSLALPLFLNARAAGVLLVYAADLGAFGEGEIELLVDLAADIAFGIQSLRTRREHQQSEERVKLLSYQDWLTGLPNRNYFNKCLDEAIEQARSRSDERLLALFLIDLDRFVTINEGLGQAIGDSLLWKIARRLQKFAGPGDTAAYLGADDFILLTRAADKEELDKIARRLQKEIFGSVFLVEGHELFITANIGISLYPEHGADMETLHRAADTARYNVKKRGERNYQLYSSEMNARAGERLTMENRLRKALQQNEFLLHYQPKVTLATGRIAGMEALVRWQNPEIGLVSPMEFISLAEETGMIHELGKWVLAEACRQNRAWQLAGYAPVTAAVNVSMMQILGMNVIETVERTLADSGLAPEYLELEITESLIMQNPERTVQVLNKFKEMGIAIAIDDFGTGYSSLNYLKRFPISSLKVDRSFVREIPDDPDDVMIVTAIINLAHNLNLKVVAEGVETQRQLNFLRERGCDEIQGYYFSKPLPRAQFEELLKTGGFVLG